MTDNVIRVRTAVADKRLVTLYLENGNTLVIRQGDHRLNDLLDAIIPITTRGEVAEISLDSFSVYSSFQRKTEEQSTGSVLKLFRVARKALGKIFGAKEETPAEEPPLEPVALSQGTVQAIKVSMGIAAVPAEETPQAATQAALEAPSAPVVPPTTIEGQPAPAKELAQEERPQSSRGFTQGSPAAKIEEDLKPVPLDEDKLSHDETIVAVIDGIVIPDIEKIRPLIEHAVKTNSVNAVHNFLKRAAAMIEHRQHSVADLLRFMERGDMPLTEDGAILAYKRLKSTGAAGVFVDCHTQRVKQKVGSYVCVKESLVDLNRRNECSNGLHIARRAYLGGFSGDLTVLCKIDPEDVVVVPHNDPDKVRVKGYHILGRLSDRAMSDLNANRPMTGDPVAREMVYNAIKGNHIARLERVEITQQSGQGVVITPLEGATAFEPSPLEASEKELKRGSALDDLKNLPSAVDPRDINKRVNEEYEKIHNPEDLGVEAEPEDESEDLSEEEAMGESVSEPMSDMELTEEMLALTNEDKDALTEAHQDIVNRLAQKPIDTSDIPEAGPKFFENAKVSHPEPKKEEPVKASAQTPAAVAKAERAAKKKPKDAERQARKQLQKEAVPKAKKPEPVKEPTKAKADGPKKAPQAPATGAKKTKAEEAWELYSKWQKTGNHADLMALNDFKRKAKKSWGVLGFTGIEISKIVNALPSK